MFTKNQIKYLFAISDAVHRLKCFRVHIFLSQYEESTWWKNIRILVQWLPILFQFMEVVSLPCRCPHTFSAKKFTIFTNSVYNRNWWCNVTFIGFYQLLTVQLDMRYAMTHAHASRPGDSQQRVTISIWQHES